MSIIKYSYSKEFWEKKENKLKQYQIKLKNNKDTIRGKEQKVLQKNINNIEFIISSYPVYKQARNIILNRKYLFELFVNIYDYRAQLNNYDPKEKARIFLTQKDLIVDPVYLLEQAFMNLFNYWKSEIFFNPILYKLLQILGTAYLEVYYDENTDPLIRKIAKELFIKLWKFSPELLGKTAVWIPNFINELEKCVLQMENKYKKAKYNKSDKHYSYKEFIYDKVANYLSFKYKTKIKMWAIKEGMIKISLEKRIINKLKIIKSEIVSLDNIDLSMNEYPDIKKLLNSYIKRYVEGHTKRIADIYPYWNSISMDKEIKEIERYGAALEYFENKINQQVKKQKINILRNEKYWLHNYISRYMQYNSSKKQFENKSIIIS